MMIVGTTGMRMLQSIFGVSQMQWRYTQHKVRVS